MNLVDSATLIGILTIAVGIIGYSLSFEGVECDVGILKLMVLFYTLIPVELVVHHVYLGVEHYHIAVHILMSLTALLVGLLILTLSRTYPREFVPHRFKDITVYGSLIWLIGKNFDFDFLATPRTCCW